MIITTKFKFILISVILLLSVINIRCNNKSHNLDSSCITISVSNVQPNKYISLSIIDEQDKIILHELSFDFSLNGEHSDSSGNYNKSLCGLNNAHTYSIMILSDANGTEFVENGDVGELKQNIRVDDTVIFNNFNTLKTLTLSIPNNITMSNLTGYCGINVFDFQTSDFPLLYDKGELGWIAFKFDGTGVGSILKSGFIPSGTYGNILCSVDTNSNGDIDSGDYYQFINGPVVITDTDTTRSFTLSSWTLY